MSPLPNIARIREKLDPFSTARNLVTRGAAFLRGDAHEFYNKVICPMASEDRVGFLLSGIFLALVRIADSMNSDVAGLNIRPFTLEGTRRAVRVIDPRQDGMARRVFIWVDSSLDPNLEVRWSLTGQGNGPLLQPGMMNEIGRLGARASVFVSATSAVGVYAVEEV